MSILVPVISDIITSIDEIDTVVESFQKGYIDNVEEVDSILDEYDKLLSLLSTIKQNKYFHNTNMGAFWDEIGVEMEGKKYSLMEALLSVLYFILITKEKYSIDVSLLCADVYMNILLLPGAFGHGMIRCSLLQVTVSAINRSVNNEDVLHLDTNYKTSPSSLINTLLSTMDVLDELTVNFAWIEFSSLCYECSFNSSLQKQLSSLFTKLMNASEKDADNRMGELLRVLLPILSLYQEGRKIEDRTTRQNQQLLLNLLNSNKKECFHNCKFALFQRLIINCPDRVDDKRNTVNCILSIMSAIPVEERDRYNSWLLNCSRCMAYNVRVCSIQIAKAILLTEYISEIENWKKEKQMEIENQDEEEMFVVDDGKKELFKDSNLYHFFFMMILGRCRDVTISIRTDAIHLIGDLLEYANTNPRSPLQSVFDESTVKTVCSTVTSCIMDTAVGVRKNALTTYGAMVVNPTIRGLLSESDILEVITNLLQDSAVSVRKSALQLYYKVFPLIPSLLPYFFPISISMFENTSNTDTVITKYCQQFVFDPIITWKNNVNCIDGWKIMEYFTNSSIPVLEAILRLLIEKNTLSIGKVVASCITAITWFNKTTGSIDEEEIKEQIPHLEENAWLLLSLLVKFYKRMDIEFITDQAEHLIENCEQSVYVNRDKYIIQLAITALPKMDTKRVKHLYSLLANELMRLRMHIDLIHSYLHFYLSIIDILYSDLPSVQKAVNLFVQRMEKKVDKILHEFIFRSGGNVRLDLPASQGMTQRMTLTPDVDPGFSQPLSQEENEDPMNTSTLLDDNPDFTWLFPYIFIIGELCVLGMEESEEGNLSKLNVRVSNRSVALLQALTTNSLPTLNSSQGVPIPSCIRAHAFISFGKMCITSATLAKKHLPMFIRELELSKDSAIRNNIIIIIGDICSKHTSIVERYIPTIANCIVDPDVVVRVHALSIISKLILEDYIKLKPVLLCCLLSSLIDSDDSIAAFSYQLITKQIYHKFPKVFVTNFVEIVCILNGYLNPSIIKEFGAKQIDIHLEGGEKKNVNARKRIYRVILELLDDENKLQISCKLCQNILGPLVDNDEVNSLNNDIHSPQLNTIIDTFAILCSKELKIGSRTKADDEDLPAEVVESKKAVLSKLEKRTMLEQVLPLLISLKLQLEKKRSILLRDLMLYFKVITVNFKQEIDVVFNDNPRLKREIEYDIRHFDEKESEKSGGLNTLATPMISRGVRGTVHSTPRLKFNRTPIVSPTMKEPTEGKVTPAGSLQVHLSFEADEKEKAEWKMDARRLSFSSPVKEDRVKSGESDYKVTKADTLELEKPKATFSSDEDSFSIETNTIEKKASKKRKK